MDIPKSGRQGSDRRESDFFLSFVKKQLNIVKFRRGHRKYYCIYAAVVLLFLNVGMEYIYFGKVRVSIWDYQYLEKQKK